MWLKLIEPVDRLVDGISMYRLLLYYLLALLAAAIGLSAAGDMHYSAIQIAASAGILVASSWGANKAFAYVFNAPVNPESSILTGLILALIIPPTLPQYGILFMLAAAGLAIASKYIFTIRRKHIFNPAAIAVVLTALGSRQSASWWVSTAAMFPFVLIGGLLIMRKTRREYMVGTFLAVTTVTTAVMAVMTGGHLGSSMHNMLFTSAVFFLAVVMLTEPYTSPTVKKPQMWYAALVGFLLAPQVHIGGIYTSPEIALVVGNVFAYIVGSKTKLFPMLRERVQLTRDTLEFVFAPERKLAYQPGQYMEWTLPHDGADARGSRRWFTLASSPTEDHLKLGVKFYDDGSTFKKAMLKMDHNTPIVAAQVAGDFVMPKDTSKKLVLIAGGIGVTPFRSMLKYMIDTDEKRPVRVLYGARTEADFAYREIFEEARQHLDVQSYYFVSDKGSKVTKKNTFHGFVDNRAITQLVPDYAECMFYISGTHPMVETLQEILSELGVYASHISVDFFPGYA